MKRPDSTVLRVWRQRLTRPADTQVTRGTRLDLLLPGGWPENGAPVHWHWQGRDSAQSGELRDLGELPADARQSPAYVWTPAADTMLTRVTVPTRSHRKIMQALPFALEERVVGDPETLHYAWRTESDGSLSVAVTARARIELWLQQLKQAGLKPVAFCPTTLLVPWSLEGWSGAFVGSELLVRTGAVSGFVCPASETPSPLLVAAIQEARRESPSPESLVVFHAPSGLSTESWSASLGLSVRVDPNPLWTQRPGNIPLNLLQGAFEPQTTLVEPLRPYWPAAILLLLWLVSSLSFDLSDWWKLKRRHNAIQKEMTDTLLATFPETKTVVDPAAQMQKSAEQFLARRGQGDREMVGLLMRVGNALRTVPSPARVRSLRYADHGLTLEIVWPSTTNADSFKSSLESGGLRAEMQSLTPHGTEVEARLRVQAADKPARSGT